MQVSRAIILPAMKEEVWAVLMDWERQADWMRDADGVRVVSRERAGVGVRLAVRTRLFGIPAFTEPMEVTLWDPPATMTIRHAGPVAGTGTWTLEPVEAGTRFTWTEDVELAVPMVGAIAARLYRPMLGRSMDGAMQGLRRYIIARGPLRHD
jgi:carbon monoxide dehydrogenase subunit G